MRAFGMIVLDLSFDQGGIDGPLQDAAALSRMSNARTGATMKCSTRSLSGPLRRAVAPIGFYSDLLAGVQGIRPRWMHLAPGSGEFSSLKVDDYAAYER